MSHTKISNPKLLRCVGPKQETGFRKTAPVWATDAAQNCDDSFDVERGYARRTVSHICNNILRFALRSGIPIQIHDRIRLDCTATGENLVPDKGLLSSNLVATLADRPVFVESLPALRHDDNCLRVSGGRTQFSASFVRHREPVTNCVAVETIVLARVKNGYY